MNCRIFLVAALMAGSLTASAQTDRTFGHSKHGSAFDSGMRTKPWKMDGIGTAPFPITTKVPEVQIWYDQGNELLHSFWFEEAERSFRWCLKLDPENAMVYFGLARCGMNWFSIGSGNSGEMKRYGDFLKEAVKRKNSVSERERLYIEAFDNSWGKSGEEARKSLVKDFQNLCALYPDDIEAKCQLAFAMIDENNGAKTEAVIEDILKVNPLHPGAHHARIHNWDGVDNAKALPSCEIYGKAVPGIGHALHMPGHVYTKVGMWHEAAICMDSATRVELRYMNERLALPFEVWNYPHNRDYLCYIQEQLGRGEASIQGALDMLNSPTDPANPFAGYGAYEPLTRALLKFEKWDVLLDEKQFPISKAGQTAVLQRAAQVFAHLAKGEVLQARAKFEVLRLLKTNDPKESTQKWPLLVRTAEAKLLIAEGHKAEGMKQLLEIAETEKASRKSFDYPSDPPSDPWPVVRVIGDLYFEDKDYAKAIEAYQTGLVQEPNDAWCLAGLAKSYVASNQPDLARGYSGRFLAVWNGADRGLRLTQEVKALGLNAKPLSETPRPERNYDPKKLDSIGPSNWHPFNAPKLECVSSSGKKVKLQDFRGKNVILVFYLSDQCPHCMEQLKLLNDKMADLEKLDTVVLAVSSATPSSVANSDPLKPFNIQLLSDSNHENARRFSSYDDFEEMELHSTILIDKDGKVRWKRTGGDPFTFVDYLIKEIGRWKY